MTTHTSKIKNVTLTYQGGKNKTLSLIMNIIMMLIFVAGAITLSVKYSYLHFLIFLLVARASFSYKRDTDDTNE